jgi:hypothetical protein
MGKSTQLFLVLDHDNYSMTDVVAIHFDILEHDV